MAILARFARNTNYEMQTTVHGPSQKLRNASKLSSLVLSVVFFDLLPILLGIKAYLTLASLLATTSVSEGFNALHYASASYEMNPWIALLRAF
jgi:hypothetical protein